LQLTGKWTSPSVSTDSGAVAAEPVWEPPIPGIDIDWALREKGNSRHRAAAVNKPSFFEVMLASLVEPGGLSKTPGARLWVARS
jgi:hypothetical protein